MTGPVKAGQTRRTIDLNADLGEGSPDDDRLLELITSASVCCNAHAGTPDVIRATLDGAANRGVAVGAHPGFADREGFGRREQDVNARQVETLVREQTEWLAELGRKAGLTLRFVKPHGALYNQAQRDPEIARGVVEAVRVLGLPLLGQPGTSARMAADARHVRYVSEGFPDRRYDADGRLVPRSRPDALLEDPDEIDAQVVRLIESGLDTLCIHGDDPNAVRNAEALRATLGRHGFAPKFWG